MANTYYDATGVLIFSGTPNMTPMLKALFGGYQIDEESGEANQVFIAEEAESDSPTWEDVASGLKALATNLGLAPADDADMEFVGTWINVLAVHFGVEDPALASLAAEDGPLDNDSWSDFGTLFDLAMWLNDGHGLIALKVEGGWHSDKLRLDGFGGDSFYAGRHFQWYSSSTRAIDFGEKLNGALATKNFDSAAEIVARRVTDILDQITDPIAPALLEAVIAKLTAQAQPA